jgi:cystathionine beta-lyase family protein involved in aluminum resistance
MNSSEQLQAAEKALSPIFYGIDTAVKQNLKKVLDSFVVTV